MPTLIESWQLGSDSAHCDQEPEKKHGEEEAWRMEEDGEGSYIKSNNPHLAGGENLTWFRDVPGMVETCLTQVPRPPKK